MDEAMQHGSMNSTGFQSNNQMYLSDTIASYRWSVDKVLKDIELFLRGKSVEIVYDENGMVSEKMVAAGTPLLNDLGVQNAMSMLRLLVGSHTVMGNYDRAMYEDAMFDVHIVVAKAFIVNRVRWALKTEHYSIVVSTIMETLRLFFSRTIDDGERKSMNQTIRSNEVNTITPKKSSGFGIGSLFGG